MLGWRRAIELGAGAFRQGLGVKTSSRSSRQLTDDRPKVSVIVPAYNAQDHLPDCLTSAMKQTLSDIEILCIDDYSNDGTAQIIGDYAMRDPRIRALGHERNRGEGATRNTGLDAATGEFVFHLDADDTIPHDALEILYREAIAHGSDLVKGCMSIVEADGTTRPATAWLVEDKIVNTTMRESAFVRRLPRSHCTYLYRRSLIDTHELRYPDLAMGADLVAITQSLIQARSITFIPEFVYHYRHSDESMTRSVPTERVARDSIAAKRTASELLREAGYLEDAASMLKSRWSYDIKQFWLRLLRAQEGQQRLPVFARIFSDFRNAVATVDVPWHYDAPLHEKYLLALVISGRDAEAVTFLGTVAGSKGFEDGDERIRTAIEYVLELTPDDPALRNSLGSLVG